MSESILLMNGSSISIVCSLLLPLPQFRMQGKGVRSKLPHFLYLSYLPFPSTNQKGACQSVNWCWCLPFPLFTHTATKLPPWRCSGNAFCCWPLSQQDILTGPYLKTLGNKDHQLIMSRPWVHIVPSVSFINYYFLFVNEEKVQQWAIIITNYIGSA